MAIDTIEVLDNLQFAQDANSEIWAVHADGYLGEAVEQFAVSLPAACAAARVVFNNNGATGSQVHGRVRVTEVTGFTASTVTKVQNVQALEWTAIPLVVIATTPQTGIVESAEIDLTNVFEAVVHIDIALTGPTAHLGTEIIVQIRKEATVDEWTTLTRFTALGGKTAFHMHPNGNINAGQKVIGVDNPTAGNLNHVGKHLFILNTTVANSEIVYQTFCGADA
ncbi:MAG: hypothetical protein CVU54_01905 [Deltaproteobacteria bacterium HGW-Deltaproteobacteria-12]|jgi:hypothetical protein|nr:MAG: hypothetical protein CVU54_01905 [Deltaproteobacteria bacterium HGW-Deltaproteobacteria-12]